MVNSIEDRLTNVARPFCPFLLQNYHLLPPLKIIYFCFGNYWIFNDAKDSIRKQYSVEALKKKAKVGLDDQKEKSPLPNT